MKAQNSSSARETDVESTVWTALRRVVDPCSIAAGVPIDVVDMGLIKGIEICDDAITVSVRPTSPFCFQLDLITREISSKVESAAGKATHVEVLVADEWLPEMMAAEARSRLRAIRPRPDSNHQPSHAASANEIADAHGGRTQA